VLTRDHVVLPATHTFIHIRNEPSCITALPDFNQLLIGVINSVLLLARTRAAVRKPSERKKKTYGASKTAQSITDAFSITTAVESGVPYVDDVWVPTATAGGRGNCD